MSSILVFDSGIGGISVAKAIHQRLPQLQINYLCDNALLPYGTQSEANLIERVPLLIEKTYQALKPDLIVIACNTASTLLLPILRERLPCQVVGVVPAIKPACALSPNKEIALLATKATLAREYTQNLIDEFADGCRVHRIDATCLVDYSEKFMQGINVELPPSLVNSELKTNPSIDTVVLGCTHFPLIVKQLSSVFKQISCWIDSGDAIAHRVESLLPTLEATPSFQAGLFLSTKESCYLENSLLPLIFSEFRQIKLD